jgi:hypothetical protein
MSSNRAAAQRHGVGETLPSVRRPRPGPPGCRHRRVRTDRSAQLNLKITPAAFARFTTIADEEKWLFAETLDHALDALDKERGRRKKGIR